MLIQEIIEKILFGHSLTPEEESIFDNWMENSANREEFFEMQRIHSAVYAAGMSKKVDEGKGWKELSKRLVQRRKRSFRFLPYAVAAAVLVIGFGISLRLFTDRQKIQPDFLPTSQQVVPGQKQAMLTLSNGRQIVLSDSLSPMTEKNGTKIRNTGNQLIYNPADTSTVLMYNTITVPRGGEYKLSLSDGSTVWVNSESEITYPVNFGRDKREIALKGEAFFEIQKDSLRPFFVKTDEFAIRVTGTQFNVRNYPEDIASATLTTGHIQLEENNHITFLRPGQQASLIGGQIQVKEVDVEEAIAWRYEAFCFKQRPLESLLNEIARWYDIDIFYQDPQVRNYHFTAWFRRSTPIGELIEILEKTHQIKLELKGKTLIVKTNPT